MKVSAASDPFAARAITKASAAASAVKRRPRRASLAASAAATPSQSGRRQSTSATSSKRARIVAVSVVARWGTGSPPRRLACPSLHARDHSAPGGSAASLSATCVARRSMSGNIDGSVSSSTRW